MYKLIVKNKDERKSLKAICTKWPEIARKPISEAISLIAFLGQVGSQLRGTSA